MANAIPEVARSDRVLPPSDASSLARFVVSPMPDGRTGQPYFTPDFEGLRNGQLPFGIDAISNIKKNPGRDEVCIPNGHSLLLWEISPLRFLRRIPLPHVPDDCMGSQGQRLEGLRKICFLDPDHLALAYADGYLEVLDIRDGHSVLYERIGGCVEALDATDSLLAVSIHPGKSGGRNTCGVAIYELPCILERGRLRTIHRLRPGIELKHVLPYDLRFTRDGATLIVLGGELLEKGVLNRAEAYDLFRGGTRILVEDNCDIISAKISDFTDSGEYLISTSKEVVRFTARHERIATYGISGYSIKYPCIDASGSRIICPLKSAGALVLEGDRMVHRFLEYGNFGILPISSTVLLSVFFKSRTFDVALFDTQDLRVFHRAWKPVQMLQSGQFDFAIDGSMWIADTEEGVRIFDKDLRPIRRFVSTRGCIKQVLCYPDESTTAMLSDSGSILKMSAPLGDHPEIHHSVIDGRPIEAGSGVRHMTFNREDNRGSLWFGGCNNGAWVGRGIEINSEGCVLKINKIIPNPDSGRALDTLKRIRFDAKIAGYCIIDGHCRILLASGDLFHFNPETFRSFPLDSNHHGLDLDGISAWKQSCGVDNPKSLAPAPSGEMLIWNDREIHILTESPDRRFNHKDSFSASGVESIIWAPGIGKYVVQFPTHLEFRDASLAPICSLFLMSDDGFCLHVPHPAENRHPGYFWCHGDAGPIFTVTDERGNPVEDPVNKAKILERYRNREYVRIAISDPGRFKEIVGKTSREAGSLGAIACAGLLPK